MAVFRNKFRHANGNLKRFSHALDAAMIRPMIWPLNLNNETRLYCKLFSVIQGPRTGKSRTVDQLAKTRITFPFNLCYIDECGKSPERQSAVVVPGSYAFD
jgi:hypothetical protein